MSTPTRPPPPLDSDGSRRASRVPAGAFVGLLALLGAARLASDWDLRLPLCTLRALTGVPCPLCGSTRAAMAAAHFDFAAAFRLNPLACSIAVGLTFWFAVWLVDAVAHVNLLLRLRGWVGKPAFPWLLGSLLVGNWLYLLLSLPK